MLTNKKLLGIGLALTSFVTITIAAVVVSGSSMSQLNPGSFIKADATVDVTTTYSLLLDDSWGYNGEPSKIITSSKGNDFTIGFSNSGSDFSGAATGKAFTTTTDGAYIYTVSLLNGISQVFVKGTSTNEKTGVTVYGHHYSQTECVDDSETVDGTLNSLIEFTPTNYVAIKFEGVDNIESVEIGYSCSEASDPFDHLEWGGEGGSGWQQSYLGISAAYSVGTNVHVTMDVSVTGNFDVEGSMAYLVDSVWGDNSRNAYTSIKTELTSEEGWHQISFDTTIRNFAGIRNNANYGVIDTSTVGNGIYILAVTHSTKHSFNYKNVEITLNYYTMISSKNKTNSYYQNIACITTDLAVGTSVQVDLDVYVTGSFDQYSSIHWVDSVSGDGSTRSSSATIASSFDFTNKTEWQHVTFVATIRNFSNLRWNNSQFDPLDVSDFGNAVYIISQNNSDGLFKYKNVSFEIINKTINGGAKSDNYQQNIACITTDLAVGASVEVSMDVYLDGSFDQYASIRWVDSIYSNGSANKTTTITSLFKDEGGNWLTGWNRISFNATVRNFSSLRLNDAYSNTVDTSSFGNAIYVIAQNKDSNAFIFKNVEMTLNYYALISSANTTGNGFYQNMTGLSTELVVGTKVTVEMDVYVTGSFNQYSAIHWVDTIADDGSTRVNSTAIASSFDFTNKTEWQHVTFTATVRNFTNLRWGSAQYNPVDVSAFGNAVYIISQNNSDGLFNYKNVVISAS